MIAAQSPRMRAFSEPGSRCKAVVVAYTRYTMPALASQDGSLPANSLMPNSLNDTAWAQNDSGGLPQKGTPCSNQGVIQSPVSAMILAISAYLGSVVSAKGRMAASPSRISRTEPSSHSRLLMVLVMA